MSQLRAVVLRCENNLPSVMCPYETELEQRGFAVETHCDSLSLMSIIRTDPTEVDVVVMDGLSPNERLELIDELIDATAFRGPKVFWITEQSSCNKSMSDEFEHELVGDGTRVRVIIRGDMTTFGCRLDFVRAWLKRTAVPVLTLVHGRPTGFQDQEHWLARDRCYPFERMVDALINRVSLRTATLHPRNDRLTDRDVYAIDCLAQSRRPLPAADLASAMTAARGRQTSVRAAVNSVKRFRRALRALGLPDKRILRTEDHLYVLERTLIKVEIKHIDLPD